MKKLFYLIATSFSLFFLTPSIANGTVYFVDLNATGTGDGISWANAYIHPQDAMDAAVPGDQIWVADGTYTRKSPTDTVVLTMKDGVDIYGGFAGVETDLSQRDYEDNVTILDAKGTTSESPCRVITGAKNARIDGFTITGANKDAAIYCDESSPTISNNTIRGNNGSGIYCYLSSPTITDNTITGNSAYPSDIYHDGGGIFSLSSHPTIINNVITDNNAVWGGGISCYNSSPTIEGNSIKANSATSYGGGVYCYESSSTIERNIISGNSAGDEGGGIFLYSSSPDILNNVITENSAVVEGGGISLHAGTHSLIINNTIAGNSAEEGGGIWNNSSPTIKNCIIWGNGDDLTGCIYNCSVTYSNVEDGDTGTGNISENPLFVDATSGDYHLQAGSPSIDSGTETNAPAEDIEGTSRPQGLGYDMGAYERAFTCTDSDGDGYYEEGGDCGEADCNDNDDSIYPGATETCNGKDDDCDGATDEGFDLDNDGFTTCGGDCDDTDDSQYPGATETCDGKDNDCDGTVDEGVKNTYYLDNDLDSYGDPTNPTQACTTPSGYVTNNTDCDDTDASVNPDGTEVCSDLKDNDCDGSQDCVDIECNTDIACVDCTDGDGDSYSLEGGVCGPVDCDDTDSAINPGATETCNEVDDNCNGSVDEGVTITFYLDSDSDGFGDINSPTQACSVPSGYVADNSDCDDTDALISPTASEICSDTIDNDCDGQSDCNDSNCVGDPACSSDGGEGDTGTSGGGCSVAGMKMSIEDALAGHGILFVAVLLLAVRRGRRRERKQH